MSDRRGELQIDASLKKLNTWFVGGNAKQIYLPADVSDLSEFLRQLPVDDEPVFLGLGSNVLIRDGGIAHTVILTQGQLNELKLVDELPTSCPFPQGVEGKEGKFFYAQAGVTCAKVAKFCVTNDLIEAEFFAGIPGTVGGALAMNAGAFGGETWPRVVAVETIDRLGNIHIRMPDEYDIGYRTVKGPAQEWFVGAYFKLPIGDGAETQQRIKALLAKRKETQPIGLPSCGSVFKNPPGDHAGRLIEHCGLKGYRIGGAEISPKHANFIINASDATAKNIEDLIHYVQETVLEKYQVQLIPEVKFLGIY